MTNEILFAKLHDDVTIPSKTEENGGFDIYAHFDEEYMFFAPNETRMVKTGLISAFDNKYEVVLKERGSTGSKGIGLRAGVVDSGFRGEWCVFLTNHNDKPLIILKDANCDEVEKLGDSYIIYPYGKAICQALALEVPKVTIRESSVDEVRSNKSERGTGMLGSSGK